MWCRSAVQKRGLNHIINYPSNISVGFVHICFFLRNYYLVVCISFFLSPLFFGGLVWIFLSTPLLLFVCFFWLRGFLNSSLPPTRGWGIHPSPLPPLTSADCLAGSLWGMISRKTDGKGTADASHLEMIWMLETVCCLEWGSFSGAKGLSCCWGAFWKACLAHLNLQAWAQVRNLLRRSTLFDRSWLPAGSHRKLVDRWEKGESSEEGWLPSTYKST